MSYNSTEINLLNLIEQKKEKMALLNGFESVFQEARSIIMYQDIYDKYKARKIKAKKLNN